MRCMKRGHDADAMAGRGCSKLHLPTLMMIEMSSIRVHETNNLVQLDVVKMVNALYRTLSQLTLYNSTVPNYEDTRNH
jgi:hypothetical protein